MIDIQTLTIGSHILYKGEKVEVFDMDYYSIGHSGSNISHNAECFDPIPITEELLKELGFDVKPFKYRLKAEKYLSEYDEFIILERMKGEDKFNVYLYISKEETHKTHLKYLHELETFVSLTTKKELI